MLRHTLMLIILLQVIAITQFSKGLPFIQPGPEDEIVATTKNIWKNHTLHSDHYQELHELLIKLSKESQGVYVQDVFSQGANGELYPRHAILLSIVAVPFYVAFGDYGFLILNWLFIVVIFLSISFVCETISKARSKYLTFIVYVLGTQTLLYSYLFSYDLFASALILGGFALSFRWPFAAGFLMSLSIFVRPSNIVYLPFLVGAFHFWKPSFDRLTRHTIGIVLGLGMYALWNYYVWGGPLITANHRMVNFDAGNIFYSKEVTALSLTELYTNLGDKFFDSRHGLVTFNLAILFLPVALFVIRTLRNDKFFYFVFLAGLAHLLIIFSYWGWNVGPAGNRYLLPTIHLWTILIIVGVNCISRNKNGYKSH